MTCFHRIQRYGFSILVSLFVFWIVSSPVAAVDDNSIINRQLEEAAVRQQEIVEEKKKSLEEITGFPEIEYQAPSAATSPAPELNFFVKEIDLSGNTIIPDDEFDLLLQSASNQEQTVTRLTALAQEVEKIYRRRGYITTYVFVPPQTVEKDTVKLQVIEGKIKKINVDGNRYFSDRLILRYAQIQPGEILFYDKLRQSLRAMNRNPDLKARLILSAGEELGDVDVTFKVKDKFPVHVGGSFDNAGNETSGSKQYGLTVRHNNLLGFNDILLTGGALAEHLGVLFGQYLINIPKIDTKFIAGASYAQSTPAGGLELFGVNSVSTNYTGKLRKTLYQTDRFVFDADAGMEFKESRTKVLSGTFRRDRLRILRFAADWLYLNPKGYTRWNHEFGIGIDGLGGAIHIDPGAARQGVEPDFFRYRSTLDYQYQLDWGHRLEFQGRLQIPSNKLPSQEALYMGGATTIRGYPEGDYLADLGYILNIEYFMPFYLIPKNWKLPYAENSLRKQVESVLFFDHGYGRLRGPSDFETRSANMSGIGTGISVKVYERIKFRLDYGYALGDRARTEGTRNQLHFQIQLES